MTTLYTIYQITNIVNNKIYVGAHQTADSNDGYMGSSKILEAAMAKYGVENFKKEILHIVDNDEHMYSLECEIVNEDFVVRKDTYNIRIGGRGGWNHINNDPATKQAALEKARTKEVQDERVKKYKNWYNGASDSEKMNCTSALMRGSVGHTREQRERANKTHSESIKGSKNPQFGKKWYIDPVTEKRCVCRPGEQPEGYVLSAGYKTRKSRAYQIERNRRKRKG